MLGIVSCRESTLQGCTSIIIIFPWVRSSFFQMKSQPCLRVNNTHLSDKIGLGVPGGPVVKNPHVNAEDTV